MAGPGEEAEWPPREVRSGLAESDGSGDIIERVGVFRELPSFGACRLSTTGERLLVFRIVIQRSTGVFPQKPASRPTFGRCPSALLHCFSDGQ